MRKVWNTIEKFMDEATEDHVGAYAAQAAFSFIVFNSIVAFTVDIDTVYAGYEGRRNGGSGAGISEIL